LTNHVRTAEPLVVITNPLFAQGYRLGRIWYFYGEREGEIDDTYLLVNIAHLCKREDFAWHLGFLMGMVSGNCIEED